MSLAKKESWLVRESDVSTFRRGKANRGVGRERASNMHESRSVHKRHAQYERVMSLRAASKLSHASYERVM